MPEVVFCLAAMLSPAMGQASPVAPTVESPKKSGEKEALAGICLTAPQRQIHTKAELEEINRQVGVQLIRPDDLRDFLLLVVRLRLEVAQGELDRLARLHKALSLGAGSGLSKEAQQSVDMTFSQCEVPLITKQLLERELYALEAWKPGMSSEKALAIADQRQQKASK